MMKNLKNTHIEHPEDSILTGDLSVLDWFTSTSTAASWKWDGAPAIVWGTNPATNSFFVGTKSVFNKVKLKINESHADIDNNHEGIVADILHYCFDNLPDSDDILQGDFIGFGNTNCFQPNVIEYVFEDVITQEIVIAPHTLYTTETGLLKDCVSQPLNYKLDDTEVCKFLQPKCYIRPSNKVEELVNFARQIATLVEFEDEKSAKQLKIDLNAYIRDNDEIVAEQFDNYSLVRLWLLIKKIKMEFLSLCSHDCDVDCYINEDLIESGEGYVVSNDYGTYKLVNREVFSYANFNAGVIRR